jgi:hypothetical protein
MKKVKLMLVNILSKEKLHSNQRMEPISKDEIIINLNLLCLLS